MSIWQYTEVKVIVDIQTLSGSNIARVLQLDTFNRYVNYIKIWKFTRACAIIVCFFTTIIKTSISKLVRTARFWNNLHRVRSTSKIKSIVLYSIFIACKESLKVWRYQIHIKKPQIEEGQIWQWAKGKKKDKRKNNDLQNTTENTQMKTGDEHRYFWRVIISCCTSHTLRVNSMAFRI